MQDDLTKARKEHTCTLCFEKIEKGELYVRQEITPWDHVENECFFTYKAHAACDKIWQEIGSDYDWEFPPNKSEWEAMTEIKPTLCRTGFPACQ